jgi:hypothetical protein
MENRRSKLWLIQAQHLNSFRIKSSIMKHTNQEETSKNQGTAGDQKQKSNKSQQGTGNEAMDSGTRKGNREHSSEQSGEGSNWQKGKQGNKK